MKKLVLAFLFVVLAHGVTAQAATPTQAKIDSIMDELQLEILPTKLIGGKMRYKFTKKTTDRIAKLLKEGKVLEIDGDGTLRVITEKEAKEAIEKEGKDAGEK